jgi:hypothetical protein
MTTDLYNAKIAAEAAYQATIKDSYSTDELIDALAKGKAWDQAEFAYSNGLAAARAEFNALPNNLAKQSAEENANDTEGCEIDQLYWFQIAISSYWLMLAEPGYDALV